MSWPSVKKIAVFKCYLFLFYAMTMNHFSIRLWYAIKSLFYTTTSGYHLSGWTEKKLQSTFQSQTHTHTHTHTYRKDHGHCCVVWYQSHLLQLSESLQIHYIWKVCSANQWNAPKPTMPAAGIGPQKGSNSFLWQHLTTRRMTNASNVEGIGLQSFASSAIFTCPFTNWLPLPQAAQQLLQGKFNSQ